MFDIIDTNAKCTASSIAEMTSTVSKFVEAQLEVRERGASPELLAARSAEILVCATYEVAAQLAALREVLASHFDKTAEKAVLNAGSVTSVRREKGKDGAL